MYCYQICLGPNYFGIPIARSRRGDGIWVDIPTISCKKNWMFWRIPPPPDDGGNPPPICASFLFIYML